MNQLERKVYDVTIGQVNKVGDNANVRAFTIMAHEVSEACAKVRTFLKKGEYVESCEVVRRIDIG